MYPGDPDAPADETINCRCIVENKIDFLGALAREERGEESSVTEPTPPSPGPSPMVGMFPEDRFTNSLPDGHWMDPDAIRRIFAPLSDMEDGILQVRADRRGENKVKAVFTSQAAKVNRTFTRDEGSLIVNHDYFWLNMKDRGLGKSFLASSMDEYERMGVDRITLHANIDVGGYAWLKYGFLPDSQRGVEELKNHIGFALDTIKNEVDPTLAAAMEASIANTEPESLWDLADLTLKATYGGIEQSIGKHLFLGSDWHGFLDLKNQSQMARFRAYTRG